MKKISLLLIFSTVVASGLFAQGVSGGLKAGVNISNQKFTGNSTSISADARVGYHAGGFLSIMFSNSFGVQPELLFNSVGSKGEVLGIDEVRRFSYLTLPFMFKYNPVDIFNIHAGPQISTLLSAKREIGNNESTIEDIKPVEFAVGVGMGLDLPMGLTAAVRYNVGLSDVNDDDNAGELNNNYLQLSLGYKFFGKK
jgi:hypothetical protein